MPDLLTPQALATAGPLVLETFFKHFFGPKPHDQKGKAREDLLYDEAFVLMKTFLEIATKYPVAALQRFGQVRTPTPPWVAVHRVVIPQPSLLQASEHLITAFGGEEMAYKIAGGTKWWQVRAGPGVEAEWIVLKKDWKEVVAEEKKAKETVLEGANEDDGEFRPEMDRLRCMLYIHGGAYYWGSINTHRYIIWRLAKKMHGRCFAVNYRKAPQYPFPCAIQDCLAAYMYLTKPPPEAVHRPVDPKSIIIAGDSAGGGLVLSLLQILRDTEGLELPAGAILISPWSDLTHSFPSILENTATDIVPPYGFIHKPSSLWPPPPPMLTDQIQSRLRARVKEAVSRLRNDQPTAQKAHRRLSFLTQEPDAPFVQDIHDTPPQAQVKTSEPRGQLPKSEDKDESDLHPLADKSENKHPEPQGEPSQNPSKANPALLFQYLGQRNTQENLPATLSQCDTPLYLDVKGEQIAIDTQIQMYATNAQLCHPWVSPILGYLGGLPPLFIMCGNNEVLRDEIIYLAHKAANPAQFPIREDVRALLPSLRDIEDKHSPTNVHFQIYDGVCHDLPLFSMTKPSRGVFRAMTSFARYVTPSAPGSLYIGRSQPASTRQSGSSKDTPIRSPSGSTTLEVASSDLGPILQEKTTASPPTLSPRSSGPAVRPLTIVTDTAEEAPRILPPSDQMSTPNPASRESLPLPPHIRRHSSNISTVTSASSSSEHAASILPDNGLKGRSRSTAPDGDDAGPRFAEHPVDDSRAKEGEAGWPGIYRKENPFTNHMIRERISTTGQIRPLEPMEELSAMTMPSDEIGMIKEGPAIRYLNGQALWDKKYHRAIKKIKSRREKNLKRAKKDGGKLRDKWIAVVENARNNAATEQAAATNESGETTSDEEDESSERSSKKDGSTAILDQSWSWTWALNGENPPPSAIISRRDFSEARQLALMADRVDASHKTKTPLHGLSIWVGLASFFSNNSERSRASEAVREANEARKRDKTKDVKKEEGTGEDGVGKRGLAKFMGLTLGKK